MSIDDEMLEEKRNEIYKENQKHLRGFEKWLNNKGLSQKTITKHVSNVDFYINDYLRYYDGGFEAFDASQGTRYIYGFFGNWFIRKAAWSSCAHIKAYAASIKKFYAFLLEANVVVNEDYDDLCETIIEYMPDWLDEMKRYDDMLLEDYY